MADSLLLVHSKSNHTMKKLFSCEKVVYENLKNSQENTCVESHFNKDASCTVLIKLQVVAF